MPRVITACEITAPISRCFDLARSIDFHVHSMRASGERAIAGRTRGMIELGEEVTWEARHLGVRQRLTSRITAMERPHRFVDEMVRGAFASLRHEHRFVQVSPTAVRLTDDLTFEAGWGIAGAIVGKLVLTAYMRRLLTDHQRRLRAALESNEWMSFIPPGDSGGAG